MKNNRSCNKCLLLSQSVRRYCRCNKQKADGNINDHLLPILHMKNRIRTSFNALYVIRFLITKRVKLHCIVGVRNRKRMEVLMIICCQFAFGKQDKDIF